MIFHIYVMLKLICITPSTLSVQMSKLNISIHAEQAKCMTLKCLRQ